jgi:hypothetical protein
MLCSARRVQRSLCGGSRWLCRFGQDRGHYPEAVGAHDHTANGRDFTCRTALMTESATDRVGCWPAWGEPAWGELPSSLRDATFAEVDIRAGDHVTHVDLRAPATAAVHCGHESPPLKFFRTLRDCGAWRHITRWSLAAAFELSCTQTKLLASAVSYNSSLDRGRSKCRII